MPSEYNYKLFDYSREVVDCVSAPEHHLRNFLWVGEEPNKVITCEVTPKESKVPLTNVVSKGLPLYEKVVRVINRELKSAGFTGKQGNRTYNIAKMLLDDATAEVLPLLSTHSSDDLIDSETRRVVRKHIARHDKRSSQSISPDGMGDSTDGDDSGDGCSLGNGIVVGGSSLNDADDFSLSSRRVHVESQPMFGVPRLWSRQDGLLVYVPFDEAQLKKESRRNYHQRYKTVSRRVTPSGRADLRKLRALEDRLIDRIDQKNRLRHYIKAAVSAVGLRDWKWLCEALTRRHRGEQLTSTERSRLHRLKIKCNKQLSPRG
jgi:hypothetical protein